VLPDLLQRFEHGELLAEGRHPLLIHRHDCEVADQWSFIEIPSHAEAARECLVMERAADVPALSATMTNPLRSVHAEIRKPLFVLDEATIATSVHRSGDEIGVIHRLCSATEEHAVVVERFVDQKS
jgi:hypothetical protein